MKARFFAIAALVLGMASCAKDFAPEANLGGEVDFTLAVSAPELAATRAGEFGENDGVNGHNSAYGAIDYLSDAEWENVDLRYTLEVYDVADDYTNAKPIKDRQVQIVDKYQGVTFETRLAPNREYHFVVFADLVDAKLATNDPAIEAQRTIGMRHDIGDNLSQITIKNDDINDEYADAYFGTMDYKPTNNTYNKVEKPMVLTRPYAKMRVVATDLHELNLNVNPGYVKVTYKAYHPNAFNAVNGKISGEYVKEFYKYDYPETLTKEDLSSYKYTEYYEEKTTTNADGKVRHTHMTLFTDYILAEDNQESRPFTMLVCDKEGNPIKETAFNTEIPVQRNHLTTIIGNVLTTATEVEVKIDDNFANEAFVIEGEFTLTEDWNVNRSIIVEEGSKAVINLNGYSIINNSTSTELGIGDGIIVYGELEINGEGTIQGNTRAIWARGNTGAKVTINGGNIVGAVSGNCEVVYASGNGQIEINGGTFEAVNPDETSFAAPQYAVLNLQGNGKTGCDIKVKGGSFKNFDPANNISENPKYDFCADGYWTTQDGDWYIVEKAMEGWYDEAANKVVAYSANDLLKWSWVVANKSNSCSLDVMRNITLPMYTVEEDKANETYKYTSTPVTISNGVPSGSNWKSAGTIQPSNKYYDGVVEGHGHIINNLTMTSTVYGTGFIGRMHNGEVHNLTFNNARLYSTTSYVAPLAYVEDGAYISNVHTTNSHIYGVGYVAGLAAEAQDRYNKADYSNGPRQRNMPATLIENCTVDANTVVYGTGTNVGGLVGQHYGAILYNCSSKANVTGTENVGGLVGEMWAYYADMHAYIINCSCTDAEVTATKQSVGGIVGKSRVDVQNHSYATNYIVGCACDVTINCSGKNVGAIVGYNSNSATYTSIIGSYAVSTLPVIAAGNAEAQTSFSVATDVTAEQIAKMNEGIAEYNAFAAAYVFPYTTPCQHDVLLPQAKLW